MFHVLNVRHGFATNSSSSHSVIFMEDGAKQRSKWDSDGFGWDFFTASDKRSKQMYVAATLMQNVSRHIDGDMAIGVVHEWVPETQILSEIPYIDHQSVLTLPEKFHSYSGSYSLDKDFFDEFMEYMLDPRVVVLGGNDNEDSSHPLSGMGDRILTDLPRDTRGKLICRKDGDWWTLFNRDNGFRVTLSLKHDPQPIKKFETPLLVDLKITNKCNQGCGFCYQDSTPEGEHADMKYIDTIATEMYSMNVFEVAIGGGEPTLHPEFAKILCKFKACGVVPNFTTRSLDWVYQTSKEAEDIRKAVIECGGALAYSVTKAEEVSDFVKALKHLGLHHRWCGRTMCVHVIPELMTEGVYTQILTAAAENGLQVTLLGLKHTGRGAHYQHRCRAFDWLKVAQDLQKTYKCPRLAVDTTLARTSTQELTDLDPYRLIWFTDEGGRSMYVDAVKQMAAPSSYSDPATFVAVPRKPYGRAEAGNSLQCVFTNLPIEN